MKKRFLILLAALLLAGCTQAVPALGTEETGLTRFSFGYFNTRRDVNDAVWALMDLLGLERLH